MSIQEFHTKARHVIKPGKKHTQQGESVPYSNIHLLAHLMESSLADGYDLWLSNEKEDILVFQEIREMSPPYMESSFSHGDGVKTYGLSVRMGTPVNGLSDWGCISETVFIPLVVHNPEHEKKFGGSTFGETVQDHHFGLLRDITQAVELILKLTGSNSHSMDVTFMSVLRVDDGRWNYECIYGDDFKDGEYSEDDIIPIRYASSRRGEPRCGLGGYLSV